MNKAPDPSLVSAWRRRFDQLQPIIIVFLFVLAISAVAATYVNDQNDRERDRAITRANTERLADNARLLGCFDRFATSLAGGLPPVRAATVARDDALQAALSSLRDGLAKAIAKTITPKDVRGIVRKFEAYEDAGDNLAGVRADNPYPEAPSEFCGPADAPLTTTP